MRMLDREVVSYLRELLLLKSGIDKDSGLTAEEKDELKTLSVAPKLDQIIRAVKAYGQLEGQQESDNTLPMEMALVDACYTSSAEGATPVPPTEG